MKKPKLTLLQKLKHDWFQEMSFTSLNEAKKTKTTAVMLEKHSIIRHFFLP